MSKNKKILEEIIVEPVADEKNTDLSEEIVEKQEHLSSQRLKSLIPLLNFGAIECRPVANLVDLMNWVISSFSNNTLPTLGKIENPLVNSKNLQCFIHNKIIIDGAFLQFCEENGVKVTCIMRDSIASWKTDHDSEHFMAQGIYQISTDKFDFLHCSLFHKGNQNEDEVSFFVVVSEDIFEQYVDLRNKFDKWLMKRDRDHLEIHVVGGEGMPYDRTASWNDLFLEDDLKADIKNYVEGFLNSKHLYEKMNVSWKTGALLWGLPGLGKSSLIRTIIAQYNFKPVTVQSGAQTNDDTITEAFAYASSQEPALLYIEDLDTMLGQTISLSHFLNMMDGVASKKGLMVIATANDLGKLKESVIDRPSRFDRKFEFPLPNFNMTKIYLKKWFNDVLSDTEISNIAKQTVDLNFSFAYLKELYIGSVYTALADKKEIPNLKNVKTTLKRMIKDKENVKHGFEPSTNNSEIGF